MKNYVMKSYLSLIPISAKNRRKQNRLTLICIVLSVFLVTSVFSLAEIMTKGEEAAMIKKHGSHHITVSTLSGENADRIAERSDVDTAAVIFVMILIAGVLMISSCMNSNVAQRTKFFGMLRCIGASKIQIMHFVRLEALNWCKTAIPIGLCLGILFTYILCAFLTNMVGGEFSDFSFRFSAVGIVCGILIGIVSVLFTAHTPAKRAAGVSPMAAVSGNAEAGKKVTRAANTRLFKVESALGVYHAVSVKKNLVLMTLSFAFTVMLFLIFFVGIDFVRRVLPSESGLNPDIFIGSVDNTNSIDHSVKEKIDSLPGVEVVFGCSYAPDTRAKINGVMGSVELVSYDDAMFEWSKNSVVSGDISKITVDSDNVLTIYNMDSRLNTGDKVKIGDTELEIACVVSEGVGVEGISVICTEETFARITGENKYVSLNAQLTEDATEETVDQIKALTGGYEFEDRREENHDSNSAFWVFRIGAYGFLAIIALITVFNIMNSISMSVSARMKQYGAMRAVGMSTRQMTKMIAAEAVTYAVCGLIIGCVAGLYLHRLLTTKLIIEHFGGAWKIPFEPIAIIILIFVSACIAAVYTPSKNIKNMAITDTINEL